MRIPVSLVKVVKVSFVLCLSLMPGMATDATAAQPGETEEEEVVESVDETDAEVRFNPVFDNDDDDIDIPVPSIINTAANHIIMNGADWSSVRKAVVNSGVRPMSIVHIGDSHIQADIGTGTVRELLQYDLGNAGRGIIAPLKMSGTNQPADYTFASDNSWIPAKLMSSNWNQVMGFTGTSIKFRGTEGELTFGTSERDDYNPFAALIIFHNGRMTVDRVTGEDGAAVQFRAIPSRDYTQILLATPQTRVKVYFTSTGDLTVFGASLSGERPGVYYHAIGNNGATFDTYNRIGTVGVGISPLKPDLIIVSLGCNEAFGNISESAFYRSIDRLVNNLRSANPGAQILLTTPMECHKSIYRTVTKKVKVPVKKKRSRKGKRSQSKTTYVTKTVTERVRSYGVNTAVKPLRDVIMKYGADKGIAVYDWYTVSGGEGASNRWIDNGLFSRDRVHHSFKGYHLQGRLLYDALVEALSPDQK